TRPGTWRARCALSAPSRTGPRHASGRPARHPRRTRPGRGAPSCPCGSASTSPDPANSPRDWPSRRSPAAPIVPDTPRRSTAPLPLDPAVEDQRQARLHARRAVGDLAEVVPALLLGELQTVWLLVEAERAVVGRDRLEVVGLEAAPQRLLVGGGPERRRHDVL